MILIGMFDSPFTRARRDQRDRARHSVRAPQSGRSAGLDRIREFNPLGRVPALVLTTGVPGRSAMIPDWLGRTGWPQRAAARIRAARRQAQ